MSRDKARHAPARDGSQDRQAADRNPRGGAGAPRAGEAEDTVTPTTPADGPRRTSPVSGETMEPTPAPACFSAPVLPYDLRSAWLILVTSAAMAFLAGLAIGAVAAANAIASSWTNGLQEQATVALTVEGEDAAAMTELALRTLRAAPGVAAAEALDATEMQALTDYWRDDDAPSDLDLAALGLPVLIDVTRAGGAEAAAFSVAALEAALASAGLTAEVHDHQAWSDRLAPLGAGLLALAYGALIAVALAAALMVALASSAALDAHAPAISVLRLVGAEDRRIVRILVRRQLALTVGGASLGALVAGGALWLFAAVAGPASEAATLAGPGAAAPGVAGGLSSWTFAALALAPAVFAGIAVLSAWLSTHLWLARQDP